MLSQNVFPVLWPKLQVLRIFSIPRRGRISVQKVWNLIPVPLRNRPLFLVLSNRMTKRGGSY